MLASIRLFFALAGRLGHTHAGRLAAARFARPRRHPRPHRERMLLARGEPMILAGGLRATAWGAGPVVLLVHGREGRGAQLGALVDPLVAAGYRVVALDGPAHGDCWGRTTTGPEFAEAMVRALETRVQAPMESFEIASFAHRVRVPVLVAHDMDDAEVPFANGERMAELLGARMHATSGLGHRRILFAPQVVRAVVEIIEEGRTSRAPFHAMEERA